MFKHTTLKPVVKPRRSRYFLFSRVNPSDKDFKLLSDSCDAIKAEYYGYFVEREGRGILKKRKTTLKGFFVLSHATTFATRLEGWFPNFLVYSMPESMVSDFDRLPSDLTVSGSHPYKGLKANLFDEGLSTFWFRNGHKR